MRTRSSTKNEPTLLPTPSPSPPSLARLRRDDAPSFRAPARRPPPLDLSIDSLKAKHVEHARQMAENVRLLHLAKSLYASPPEPVSGSPGSDDSAERRPLGGMRRYQIEVERIEGGEKVLKRVTVIVPSGVQGRRDQGAPYVVPDRQAPLFISPSRRLSLPALHTLSLIPSPKPARLFQSAARHALPPSPVERSQQHHHQRRRPALTLRHSVRGVEAGTRSAYSVSSVRGQLARLREEAKRTPLGERRGKPVPPLRLV
ncbi:hypothetical protein JCM10207_006581 [Rhodosporidiobolus poonsookiae]